MNMRTSWRSASIAGVVGALSLTAVVSGAPTVNYDLQRRTHAADFVAHGRVAGVDGTTIEVRVRRSLKGHGPETVRVTPAPILVGDCFSLVEVPWPVAAGDDVLLFLGTRTEQPVTVPEGVDPGVEGTPRPQQGVVKIAPASVAPMIQTVKLLHDLETPSGPERRRAALAKMLAMDFPPAAFEALGILEGTSPRTMAMEALVVPVVTLARRGDPGVRPLAVQVLGRIGDKSTIPVLLDLMVDADVHVAKAAFWSFKTLTGENVDLDAVTKSSRDGQRKMADRWRQWWSANSDKVVLRR